MGKEGIITKIKNYEEGLYLQTKNMIDIFESIREKITKRINSVISDIAQSVKSEQQYDIMKNDISAFKNGTNGKDENNKIGKYDIGSNNSSKQITSEELKKEYAVDEQSSTNLGERIDEANKEKKIKEDYYNEWVGLGTNADDNSLNKLIMKYDYDKKSSGIRFANVLEKIKITNYFDSLDKNYDVSNSECLVFDAKERKPERTINFKLTKQPFGAEIGFDDKNVYLVDDMVPEINMCISKLKNYKNYCSGVYDYINNFLYDDKSEGSFAKKVNDFFGAKAEDKGTHAHNKKSLNDINESHKQIMENNKEVFLTIERLEDYYYKEGSESNIYFEAFGKERANDYDKKLDERKNFIKSFCDDFESEFNQIKGEIFVKKGEIENLVNLKFDKDYLSEKIENQNKKEDGSDGGTSVEFDDDLMVSKVKIKWNAIFQDGVKVPWSEVWETEKVNVKFGDMNISYPKAFEAFDEEFVKCIKWLQNLKEDIDILDGNIKAFEARKTEIDKELEAQEEARKQAEREAQQKAEEEARQQAEEQARQQAEQDAQRRQEELDAIKDAMGGGDE